MKKRFWEGMDSMHEVDEKTKIDPAAIALGIMMLASMIPLACGIVIVIIKAFHH